MVVREHPSIASRTRRQSHVGGCSGTFEDGLIPVMGTEVHLRETDEVPSRTYDSVRLRILSLRRSLEFELEVEPLNYNPRFCFGSSTWDPELGSLQALPR